MSETCKRCGRPAWVRHGGMGGSIMPDDETHCLRTDARSCRTARAGFVAGIRDGVALAKRELNINYGHWGGQLAQALDWTDVDREAAKLAGEVEHDDA